MNVAFRIFLGIGVFLAVAGTVYGLTSGELAGTTNLLVGAATVLLLAIVFRIIARQQAAAETSEPAEVEMAPTIWPFGFAIAAVLIALGLIVNPWILILGGLAFAISAAGWLREVARSRRHANEA